MNTRDEARGFFHGPPKSEPITFEGLSLEVVMPEVDVIETASRQPSERRRDSYLTWRCLRAKDGVPVFDTFEEVLGLRADRALIVDRVKEAILRLTTPAAPPQQVEPPPGSI